ncbi:hypothetical protein F3J38_26195 [Pantoea sp. Acro-805]|uniref:Inner membrane protein n=1 Tax=Candidatus Pantoea formicae TaxID=2608355 RepID=A0ABX0R4I4_9GAMM|nr:hypothetical protein [Pantoea formicae]NIF03496.1 hypothetical protein [Pantoea formicae]
MLTFSGAARTLIVWFTLFFAWSAVVLWQFGPDIVKTIMTESHLFAFDLASRMVQSDMVPPGIITALLVLMVLAAGGVLSALTIVCWNLLCFICCLPLMAGVWLQRCKVLTRHAVTGTLK